MNSPNESPDETGISGAQSAKKTAENLADHAKDSADSAMQNATKAAARQADAAKSSVADEVSGVASALRTAAQEMRSGSPQERTFGQIAEGLADASDALRDKDLGTMVQDVTQFARKNPLMFLGGAALIGFAATRFAKASGETDAARDSQYASSLPTQGDLS